MHLRFSHLRPSARSVALLALLPAVVAATTTPTIKLFPTTVMEDIKATGSAARQMESGLQEVIARLDQQQRLHQSSKCEGAGTDPGCEQITRQLGATYLEMLDAMDQKLPAMEQAVNQLGAAFQQAKDSLSAGCQAHFDRYLTRLLAIAEGDPQPDNKRYFSEFLVWSTDQGLVSKRQAREHYNRYFSPKFVALMGDYNNCASTCPAKNQVLHNMRSELQSKETGLLKVSRDREGYYRADCLFQETELVLEATCQACATSR